MLAIVGGRRTLASLHSSRRRKCGQAIAQVKIQPVVIFSHPALLTHAPSGGAESLYFDDAGWMSGCRRRSRALTTFQQQAVGPTRRGLPVVSEQPIHIPA